MVEWATVNTVSSTSGGSVSGASTLKTPETTTSGGSVYRRYCAPVQGIGSRVSGGSGASGGAGVSGGFHSGVLFLGMGGSVYVTSEREQSSASYSSSSGTTESGQVVQLHAVTDDGQGRLYGAFGAVDYDAMRVQVRLEDRSTSTSSYNSDHEQAREFERTVTQITSAGSSPATTSGTETSKGGEYSTTSVERGILAGSSLRVTYAVGTAMPQTHSSSHALGGVALDLAPLTTDELLPGSVQFTWGGQTYKDFEGTLYAGRTDSTPGTAAGSIDYGTGMALMETWTGGGVAARPVLQRLWTHKGKWSSAIIFGRTSTCPVRPGGLTLTAVALDGESITAQVNAQGVIEGPDAWGAMDFATGYFQIMFGHFALPDSLSVAQKAEWWYDPADIGSVQDGKVWVPRPVDPTSLRYNAVTYTYLPIDGDLMGLTAERLPPDGRMPFVRAGDYCVIGRTIWGAAFAPSAGMTYNVGTPRLSSVDIIAADADGGQVLEGWSCDLDAGTVTIDDPVGWPAQVIVRARVEVYRRVAEVAIDGTVRLTTAVGHAFDAGDVLSTAVRFGDKYAHVLRMFDQQSWNGTTWKDVRDGNEAVGNYDEVNYPVQVNNRGTITEKWALRLRADGQTFDLIGEHMGQIASGNINEDFSPQNHNAGTPYFTIKAAGWGAGWTAGNVLFIHTVGAEMPFAFVRSVSPGPATQPEWRCLLAVRGSVDQPPSNPFGGN